MVNTEAKRNMFTNIKKWITVEPVLIAFGIPFYLQTISLQNFALEKSCRVNLQFSAIVCDNMMDKSTNGINCGNVDVTLYQINETVNELKEYGSRLYNTKTLMSNFSLEQEACRAEINSQKLLSSISGYMAPIESVLCLAIILIGGYWSDKSGRRKPLILLPIVGDFVSLLIFLFNALFMTQLPVQFFAVAISLIKGMSGGLSLQFMGVYCYLTETTVEKDRTFRLGLLYQIYPLMAMCTLPFSGIMYRVLGYVKLAFICLLFEVGGILYTTLILKESRVAKADNATEDSLTNGIESLEDHASKISENDVKSDNVESNPIGIKSKVLNAIREVVAVLMKKRNGNGKIIIWLILLSNFLYAGCEYELINEYFFVRTKLNWEALEESPFAAFGGGTTFFGNMLMTTIFSKYFGIADAVVGLISSAFSTTAKLLYITVSTTFMLYLARSFDMFLWACDVTNRSILTTIVSQNEIGRVFSLMGLLESFSKLVFVPMYTYVYKETVDTFPNAYFIVSFLAMAIVTAIFG